MRANSVSDPASLSAPSAKILCHEARGKARQSANSKTLQIPVIEFQKTNFSKPHSPRNPWENLSEIVPRNEGTIGDCETI